MFDDRNPQDENTFVVSLKRLVWLLALIILIPLSVMVLQGISQLFRISQQASTQLNALNSISLRKADEGMLTWLPDNPDSPRKMSDFEREQLSHDYLLAYEELNYALLSEDISGLESHFQEGALADVLNLLQAKGFESRRSQEKSQFITWDHQLELYFYSPDGITLALRDSYHYAQAFVLEADILHMRFAKRSMDVLLNLNDGNWRIHHWRILQEESLPTPDRKPLRLDNIYGINYIARSAPFNDLWPKFNPAEVEEDFARIQGLGLNTVRFFIPFPAPEGLFEHLPNFLALAERYELRLIPTLFDTYTCYCLEDMPKAMAYLDRLLPYLNHPSVLIVDVKNEADSDFSYRGKNRVRTFLTYILRYVRSYSDKPAFVGLINLDEKLIAESDAISLHHYDYAKNLPKRIAEAKSYQKPILLEEFGFHTQIDKWPDPHTRRDQAIYYQDIFAITSTSGLGWLVWTLYDLPEGSMPGGREVERHLGILDSEARAKEVIQVLRGHIVEASWLERTRKYLWLSRPILLSLIFLLMLGLALSFFSKHRK
ncbi:MAG: hypothetical protein R2880_18485 [Deinococcales bacterium]